MGGTISQVAAKKLQTHNIFTQQRKITSCGVKNKTQDHASVTAHRALTLADRSQEKLLKGRVETESGGTRRRTGGEVKGKEANGVGS